MSQHGDTPGSDGRSERRREVVADDDRSAVGPVLRTLVGTPARRTWLRRTLGPPALLLRWVSTRRDTRHRSRRRATPSAVAPTLTTFPDVQLPSDGTGPGIHRAYSVTVPGAATDAEPAMQRLTAEPNLHCTIEIGSFESDDGRTQVTLDAGRDLYVELTGPFRGPVRVIAGDKRHVHLQTRRGHIEAGQIVFETSTDGDDLVFTISSWTRSRDRLVDVLYRAGPARWLQQHMWISVCRQVALASGATRGPVVSVTTEWLPPDVGLLGEDVHGGSAT